MALLTTLVMLLAPAAAQAGSEPPHFGFNDDWVKNGDQLEFVQQAGADVTRAVISWQVVEPEPGQFDFSAYDALVEQFRAVGTRPLWVLADAPCWAQSKDVAACESRGFEPRPPRRNAYDEWARFAALVAHRYQDTVAIEAWNEANLDNFWMPRPNPARAAEVTAWANFGVDYSNSINGTEIPTLFGGSAPLYETIPEKREIAYDEFLREAYEEIPGGYWDGVAIHPFPRFKARKGYLDDIEEHLDAIRVVLFDARAIGTPIWVTEVGLSTAGPFPYSLEDQARGLKRIYRLLKRMPDVPVVVVHRLIDGPKKLETAESGWGVVQRDLTPKPALCSLATVRGAACVNQ